MTDIQEEASSMYTEISVPPYQNYTTVCKSPSTPLAFHYPGSRSNYIIVIVVITLIVKIG